MTRPLQSHTQAISISHNCTMANTHIPNGNTPPTPFTLGDFCIDEYEPIKVIVIGAGFSGILAGIRCVPFC